MKKKHGRGTHRYKLRMQQKFRCYWCLRDLPPSCETIDHIMPKCRGGGGELENKCLACAWCNAMKGDRLPNEYLRWVRSLPKSLLGRVHPKNTPDGFRPAHPPNDCSVAFEAGILSMSE